jgi:hypothetical protein
LAKGYSQCYNWLYCNHSITTVKPAIPFDLLCGCLLFAAARYACLMTMAAYEERIMPFTLLLKLWCRSPFKVRLMLIEMLSAKMGKTQKPQDPRHS